MPEMIRVESRWRPSHQPPFRGEKLFQARCTCQRFRTPWGSHADVGQASERHLWREHRQDEVVLVG